MKEAFELMKRKIMQDRRIGRSSLEAFLEILKEVEAEYGNKSTEHINKLNNWVDVKDRLPEKDGYYLTCDHKGNIHVFYHHPSYVADGQNMAFGICKNHPQFYQPIAWMPLPEPYKPEKGAQE